MKIKTNTLLNFMLVLVLSLYSHVQEDFIVFFKLFDIITIAIILVLLSTNRKLIVDYKAKILILFISIFIVTTLADLSPPSFFLSEIRTFIYTIVTYVLILQINKIYYLRVFYSSVVIISILYVMSYLNFDISIIARQAEINSISEDLNRNYGPSIIGVILLLLSGISKDKIDSKLVLIVYTVFIFVTYYINMSRMSLLLGLIPLVYYLIKQNSDNQKKILFYTFASILIFLTYIGIVEISDNRLKSIFNPFQDTSFLSRVYVNSVFIKEFLEFNFFEKIFGLGLGSTIKIYYNEIINGQYTIIDNSIFTIVLKTGIFGLIFYLSFIYMNIKYLNNLVKYSIIVIIIITTILTAHIYTNIHYMALLGLFRNEI